MTARVLTGTRQEIVAKVAGIEGDVREVIVFVDEPATQVGLPADLFKEMDPFAVDGGDADDSREALYQRREGE